MLDGQFAGGNDAFGLVPDVEQDLVTINLDDGAFDDISVIEVLDCCIDGCEEVLGGADVVDCNLLGGAGDRHVVGNLVVELVQRTPDRRSALLTRYGLGHERCPPSLRQSSPST